MGVLRNHLLRNFLNHFLEWDLPPNLLSRCSTCSRPFCKLISYKFKNCIPIRTRTQTVASEAQNAIHYTIEINSDPGGIQTPNTNIRSVVRYSVAPRGRFIIGASSRIRTYNHAYALPGWSRLVTPMSTYIYFARKEGFEPSNFSDWFWRPAPLTARQLACI